jgi:hypothetical protein
MAYALSAWLPSLHSYSHLPVADTLTRQVYDGDTPQYERGEIRARAQLLITNPDMMHRRSVGWQIGGDRGAGVVGRDRGA